MEWGQIRGEVEGFLGLGDGWLGREKGKAWWVARRQLLPMYDQLPFQQSLETHLFANKLRLRAVQRWVRGE